MERGNGMREARIVEKKKRKKKKRILDEPVS